MEVRIIAGAFEALGLSTIGFSIASALGADDGLAAALADQTWFWVGVVLVLVPMLAFLLVSRRGIRTASPSVSLPEYVMLDCPGCGSNVRSDAKTCRYCGATLR